MRRRRTEIASLPSDRGARASDYEQTELSKEEMWQAVLSRDPEYNGSFVYAVKTTGVYCPPSCPSRRPNKENVAFYSDATTAESGGFRPCRRCRGNARVVEEITQAKVVEAIELIEAAGDITPTLEELGRQIGLSPAHLQRVFTRVVGISPHVYGEGIRMGRFRSLLRSGGDILTAVYQAGFGSPSRAYEKAANYLGMTPGAYRDGAVGMEVRYSVSRSTLGAIVIAATDRGVCLVRLGNREDALETELREEFPRAAIVRDDQALTDWMQRIVGYVDGSRDWPLLPIDVRGSAFERTVWDALRRIPYGETLTYTQLAEKLGAPRATRAVARACARNPVVLVVPCHRIVPKSGGVGGYRWGTDRKRRLLEMEARNGSGESQNDA